MDVIDERKAVEAIRKIIYSCDRPDQLENLENWIETITKDWVSYPSISTHLKRILREHDSYIKDRIAYKAIECKYGHKIRQGQKL